MTALDKIAQLRAERAALTARLAPLNKATAAKRSDLAQLRSRLASADSQLDTAIRHAATIAAAGMTGVAAPEQVAQAEQQRVEAEKAHAALMAEAATVRKLENEVAGMEAAAAPHAQRLHATHAEEREAVEAYVRELGAEFGAEYLAAAGALAEKFAAILAVNMTLARMDGAAPNLMTPATQSLTVPGFNLPATQTPNGLLFTFERVREMAPIALSAVKARMTADGIAVPGL